MATVAERVQRGIDWLDENAPGWRKRITFPRFNIGSPCDCVLGCVFEQEAYECDRYATGYSYGVGNFQIRPDLLGFDLSDTGEFEKDNDGSREFAALQAEWTRRLKEHQ